MIGLLQASVPKYIFSSPAISSSLRLEAEELEGRQKYIVESETESKFQKRKGEGYYFAIRFVSAAVAGKTCRE